MTTHALGTTANALLTALLPLAGFDLTFSLQEHSETDLPRVSVQFEGSDTPLLLARHAELLHALEHLAAKAAHLEPEEHDLIRFDAAGYKAGRDRELEASARMAVDRVRSSGQSFRFPPMTSRERRLLHLALAGSGLHSASEGEAPRRYLVLHPPESA